ncbi:hypothetical protein HY488_02465 [Candidatus Woesearchaeota archaeon]|nr:hypothetical protein [Candidatus Woesearchaeota archaeon]
MAKTLDAILHSIRVAGFLAVGAITGCGAGMFRYARVIDADGDGRMDMLEDSFYRNSKGRTVYQFQLRRGGASGTPDHPQEYLGEVRGEVELPAYASTPVRAVYFQDIDGHIPGGDKDPEMLTVERTGDKFSLHAQEPYNSLDPQRLRLAPPTLLVKDRPVEQPSRFLY